MKFGQQDRSEQRDRRTMRRRTSGTIAGHRMFAPLLGLWGAMLGGLTVMVLPAALVEQALDGTALVTAGLPVQAIAAVLAALLLGGGLFVLAGSLHRRARRAIRTPSLAEWTIRSMRPIDPLRDLGSRSLDDPIEAVPFAASDGRDRKAPDPVTEHGAVPRELDLAASAELPGRNAVWVEDAPQSQPVAAPIAAHGDEAAAEEPTVRTPVSPLRKAAPVPDPGTAALARLRAVAPSELSLVEMVERFAGALHEHRTSPPTKAVSAAELAAREAALAEALKALAALSGDNARDDTREPLRTALAHLHTRRGTA